MTAIGAGAAGGRPLPCPEHGQPGAPDHRFCEECGRELARAPVEPGGGLTAPAPALSGSGSVRPVGSASVAPPPAPAEPATGGWSISSTPLTARWGAPQIAEQTDPVAPPGPVGPRIGSFADPVVPAGLGALAPPTLRAGPEALAGSGTSSGPRPPVPPAAVPLRPAGSPAPTSPAGPVPAGVPAIPSPATAPASIWLSSRAPGQPCPGCGAVPAGNPGHCAHCGHRGNVGRDRADLNLGTVAAVTDRARRRRNEDAVAVGRLGRATAAVVCDGVSTSLRADIAAHAAAESGLAAMLSALSGGAGATEAIMAGGRAAAAAVGTTAAVDDGPVPPSCTYVAAVVTVGSVTVGWIGDSRAYWLGADHTAEEAVCLTIDDSVVEQIRVGRPVPPGAELDPTSKALLRWLGADSKDADPQVVTFQPTRSGRLVLCSDGLSHYLPDPAALAVRVPGPSGPAPISVARDLTGFAVRSGGHDNVGVAVLPFPPIARPGDPAPEA